MSGLHTAGMQAGAFAINFSAVLVMAWAIATCASAPTAIGVFAAVTLYALRSGGDTLVSAWNPHVVVLPMMAFIVVAASLAATGRRTLIFWLVGLGTFLVQTHLAMTPLVGALLVLVAIAQPRAVSETWPRAAALTLALWMPPLVDELTRRPGNLTKIVLFFVGGTSRQPIDAAAAAWASALTSPFRPGFVVAAGLDLPPVGAWSIVAAFAQLLVLGAVVL
ncbi:MAG TPA: hypothetical protein VH137_08925, partial [Gemmatimonadales bacterium]|nr:hypothetical protein [Gemmatimonadales bacterium]